uniref:Uncharacterized protein n=1 Tax=Anguilla anguilla TaxID=7936 RepID=A0A0E9W5Y1_ANGAN
MFKSFHISLFSKTLFMYKIQLATVYAMLTFVNLAFYDLIIDIIYISLL